MTPIPAASRPVQIAVCDGRKASLYRGAVEWPGRLRLSEVAALTSPWWEYHEHGRPSALGYGPAANAAQRFAGLGHEEEELARRFARDVASLLHQEVRPIAQGSGPAERLAPASMYVFAAPRFLGHLREALGPTGDGIELFRGEFTALRAGELAAHPTIRAIVGANAPGRLHPDAAATTAPASHAPSARANGAD